MASESPDEDQVDAGRVDDARGRRVVGGDHHDAGYPSPSATAISGAVTRDCAAEPVAMA